MRPRLVLVPRLLVLALHDDVGRQVDEPNRRLGGVHALPAGPGGTEGVDPEILLVDLHLTSSASGSTATVTAEVWIRPWVSVSGTRCTRCTPLSNFSRL